uniref:Neutral ceramidase n=1 Tax=Lygus hesperus TaxID=30085 RepID=A0A146ME47_LYGHE
MALLIPLLVATLAICCHGYQIGVGIADITGPPAEVPFMGYANPKQKGYGIHLRQFARSFIIDDGSTRIVFVTCDMGMMGTFLRREVLKRLAQEYGDQYTVNNVMISGTHTHSTPGGFLLDIVFDLNSWGFVRDTFENYAAGIVRSIQRAHKTLADGKIFVSHGQVLDANINRSPTSYLRNPAEERAKYDHDTDKSFTQLKFIRSDGVPMGVITWYAVHATSMNNTNHLISSDNVGYASVLFEKKMNKKFTNLIGKGPFVAAFASTNLGDVSPNTAGPRCVPSGDPCDAETSTCKDKKDTCIASGPGKDMFESTQMIATKIFEKAWEAWKGSQEEVKGDLGIVHQYVSMPDQKAEWIDPETGENKIVNGCKPAMGYSFAAGTTDGAGAFSFKQGTVTTNPLWNLVTDILARPSKEMVECQAPKPILLATGEMNFPFEWQPSVVSTQLAKLGQMAIACVPGEFTTMSGRRMRQTVSQALGLKGPEQVIVAGLCNTYSDYITTPQEYQAQRYEAASTIFGPHTLTIYLQHYKGLAGFIKNGSLPDAGPSPPEAFNDVVSFLPGVVFDNPGWGKEFGQCVVQPPQSVQAGATLTVTFAAGHPRNNVRQEGSYLSVERLGEGEQWEIVATDADWETKFIWRRTGSITGTSEVDVVWDVPMDVNPGTYRIRHFGSHKLVYGAIRSYIGISQTFQVTTS